MTKLAGVVLPLMLASTSLGAACGAPAPVAMPPQGAVDRARGDVPGSVPSDRAPASGSASPPPQGAMDLADGGAPGSLPEAQASVIIEADGGAPPSACNDQPPQDFLIRGHFLREPAGNERAIQYRTDQYGYFKGYGHPPADAQPPSTQVVATTFMGLPIRMHRKVAPALACVEKEIDRACAAHPYTPRALAGIRFRNTYRGGEVTNHAYGIAIDIDPAINTCCGCVKPWSDAPACKRAGKSEYDHMAMPECWVHAFERYGFYWLGHDVLRDTMHFEFLGDPDKIVRAAAPPPGS